MEFTQLQTMWAIWPSFPCLARQTPWECPWGGGPSEAEISDSNDGFEVVKEVWYLSHGWDFLMRAMEALLSLSSRPSCLIGCRGTCCPTDWLFWSWRAYILHWLHSTRHGWVSVLETLLVQCVVIMWLHKRTPFFYKCSSWRGSNWLSHAHIVPHGGEMSDTGRLLEEDECLAHLQA